MKNFSIGLLGIALLGLSAGPVTWAQLNDARGTQASTAVQFLVDEGIIKGYQDGTFRPEQDINRAEFLKLVLEASDKTLPGCKGQEPAYKDVSATDWWADIVCSATSLGIVEGYEDGTFRPSQTINLAESSKIVAKVNALEADPEPNEAWYQPFLRALQEYKVLADTLQSFGQTVNRGEMAQMIWGLRTGNEVNEAALAEELPQLASCQALQTEIKRFQTRQNGDRLRREAPMMRPMLMETDASFATLDQAVEAPAASSVVGRGGGGADKFSTTNVQEFGVDEADIIKNDGEYIYLIKEDAIRIVHAYPPSELKEVAKLKVDAKDFYPREMYVEGDVLTVVGQSQVVYAYGGGVEPLPEVWSEDQVEIQDSAEQGRLWQSEGEVASMIAPGIWPGPGNHKQMLTLVSYDISDRSAPKVIRTVSIEGNYQSSRKVGDTVYLVSNKYNHWYWGGPVPLLRELDLPTMTDSADEAAKMVAPCSDIYYYPNFEQANYLIVAAIDTVDTSEKVDRLMMLGSGEQVYASSNNLYVTRTRYEEQFVDTSTWTGWRHEPRTHIYRFALEGNNIKFAATGSVPGRVLNQFSMSEAGDHFRIATQTDGADGSMMNILDMNLELTGSVDGIAPGENIKAVRFMGDKAYMITFENVDPLFVIDLEPRNPKVLGELKIPGWSDYLHPYDDQHLIGIGREVKEGAEEDGRLTSDELLGLKLAIFDVSDVHNPKEIHKKVVGDNGTNSEATHNHKAFLFDPAEKIMALPISVMQQRPGGSVYERDQVFQGAFIYDVDLVEGFVLRGKASHYDEGYWQIDGQKRRYGNHENNIQRVMYMGQYWFTVSPNVVAAHTWDEVAPVSRLKLDTKPCKQIYDEYECGQAAQCKTIWREWSECYTNDEDFSKVCEAQQQFSRCEAR